MNQAKPPPLADELTSNVLAVVASGLNFGAALSRGIAELASGGRPVPPPAESGPIPAMLHYALETTRELAAFAPFTPRAEPRSPARPSAPAVQPGATLRIPLSIENPSTQPMHALQPTIISIQCDGADVTVAARDAIEFVPPSLTIAPRDLEKLTVLITPPATTPPGRYEIRFLLREGDPEIPIIFDVLVAD
jgi:hypothetical protein